jgi:uncharacterized protein involved in exopolysaccharide biosynthesis
MEMRLPTKANEARSSEARARAEASFRKEERAKDGAKAMMEYQANSRVLREKTARLKALRLEKEAADKEHELAGKAASGKR